MSLPTAPLPDTTLVPLLHDSHLLSLLHHRNRNQHRLTKWYRHLTTLHRHLRHLLHGSTLITTASTTPERDAAITRADQRISYLRDTVVPRAWDAFGTVVRDKQFAPLGIILWGVLGRVWMLLGGDEITAKEREAELEGLKDGEMRDVEGVEEGMEDVMEGEVLSREAYESAMKDVESAEGRVEVEALQRKKVRKGSPEEKEKKKKKKRMKEEESGGEAPIEDGERSKAVKQAKKGKKGKLEDATESPEQRQRSISEVPKKRKKRPVDEDSGGFGESIKSEEKKKKKSKKRKKDDDIDALFSGIF
ncbi:hypothetical protein EX30DRAFT_337282 [Ascodesmis nigricans]|uniref:RNase MRP protein 1 RNA binding domain-containing protein n=1 Tax=Ascodesmis nigricans TaxID=341454 RepID=A0A4V3SJP4_9PEZI|nr:hypothetical protein EX30DRAFT_337282 [Ascodesmis nigricans]